MSSTSSLYLYSAALVTFASLTVYGPLKPSELTFVILDWFDCMLETRMWLKVHTYSCRLFGYISSLLSKIQTFFPPQCYCENANLLILGKRFPVLSVSYVHSYPKRKTIPEETVMS